MASIWFLVVNFVLKHLKLVLGVIVLILIFTLLKTCDKQKQYKGDSIRWQRNFNNLTAVNSGIKKSHDMWVTTATELKIENGEFRKLKKRGDSTILSIQSRLNVVDGKYKNLYEMYIAEVNSKNDFDIPERDTTIVYKGDTITIKYGVYKDKNNNVSVFKLPFGFNVKVEKKIDLTIVKIDERICPEGKFWNMLCERRITSFLYKKEPAYKAFSSDSNVVITKLNVVNNKSK
jgi:hypothetical protein